MISQHRQRGDTARPRFIEIDFEVFKELTSRRTHEGDTYNAVLKRLIATPEPPTVP